MAKHAQYTYDSDGVSPDESREDALMPGKFQGEPDYISYMWSLTMLWGNPPDDDLGEQERLAVCAELGIDPEEWYTAEGYELETQQYWVFNVRLIDVLYFPELADVSRVIMWESESGFVYSDSEYPADHYLYFGI